MKTRIITWAVFLSAFLDSAYSFISDNPGVLEVIGVSPKLTKLIMFGGMFWTAFSKSLAPKPEAQPFIGTPRVPKKN